MGVAQITDVGAWACDQAHLVNRAAQEIPLGSLVLPNQALRDQTLQNTMCGRPLDGYLSAQINQSRPDPVARRHPAQQRGDALNYLGT